MALLHSESSWTLRSFQPLINSYYLAPASEASFQFSLPSFLQFFLSPVFVSFTHLINIYQYPRVPDPKGRWIRHSLSDSHLNITHSPWAEVKKFIPFLLIRLSHIFLAIPGQALQMSSRTFSTTSGQASSHNLLFIQVQYKPTFHQSYFPSPLLQRPSYALLLLRKIKWHLNLVVMLLWPNYIYISSPTTSIYQVNS